MFTWNIAPLSVTSPVPLLPSEAVPSYMADVTS